MNISSVKSAKNLINRNTRVLNLVIPFLVITHVLYGQTEFDKVERDKSYKKGTNVEYYKNGSVKSVCDYKRKVFYYYTDTYWTIKEYDMDGNLVRMVKKVTQTARRENAERVIKEEVFNYEPKKENNSKETIRPEEN